MFDGGNVPEVDSGQLSRRGFLKYCTALASLFALPPAAVPALAGALQGAARPSVIWLSFQECTGCSESFSRSHAPTLEALIFDHLSLDYHHLLQAAAGEAAESARREAMARFHGRYLLVVDGAVSVAQGGVCSTIAGRTNLQMLEECAEGASAVIVIGSCAAFGGLPAAAPNPTGAVGVAELMQDGRIPRRPLVNLPGCPPLPLAISGVLAHYLAFGAFPALDELGRPKAIYGNTVHERCSRYHFYEQGLFAESFDDEGARLGWCLYKLGCKGPVTHNACAVSKWNQGTSFPVEAGHPCIGCAEPGFWDRGPFYTSLDEAELPDVPGAGAVSDVEQGRQLYEGNCVYCHSLDPGGLRTEPDQVAGVLRSGQVRAHRRFEFSEGELEALGRYLKSNR